MASCNPNRAIRCIYRCLFRDARFIRLDRATRWFLQSRGGRLNVEEEIAKFTPVVAKLTASVPGLLRGVERQRANDIAKKYQDQGVPADLAIRTGSFLDEFSLLDVIEIANREKSSAENLYQNFEIASMLR